MPQSTFTEKNLLCLQHQMKMKTLSDGILAVESNFSFICNY